MKLNEVLNSELGKNKITWQTIGNEYKGLFEYDDITYEIYIQYHDLSRFKEFAKIVYEIHFSILKNGEQYITMSNQHKAGRILSIIKNAVVQKFKSESLHPDIIITSVSLQESDNTTKTIDSRKRMYGHILSAFKHEIGFNYEYDWVTGINFTAKMISKYELNGMEYMLMTKVFTGK